MRSVQVSLLGLVTIVGGVAGIANGFLLLSIYVIHSLSGTSYNPPLNIIGNAWILLGVVSVLLGSLFIVAGATGSARSMLVWVISLGTFAALTILSIAQTNDYSANASYAAEESNGLVGAILGVLLTVYLMTPHMRTFFHARLHRN